MGSSVAMSRTNSTPGNFESSIGRPMKLAEIFVVAEHALQNTIYDPSLWTLFSSLEEYKVSDILLRVQQATANVDDGERSCKPLPICDEQLHLQVYWQKGLLTSLRMNQPITEGNRMDRIRGFDAKVVNKLSFKRIMIGIVSNPIKKRSAFV
ncbi:hypothetical protein Tco_0938306 [Tanacetum coccineum]|uniref:Uncharacterized protein n=1 Tax=Tanacetum coccineum TaxID=301880 RepID=A0ABQ5DGT8_9ASTR